MRGGGLKIVKKYEITKDLLSELYNDKNMTMSEIADYIGCSSSVVGYWIKKYNIKTRSAQPREKWNKNTMQLFCDENKPGYEVLDTKWINKGYQKQKWALIACCNKSHKPCWVWWNNFINEEQDCKECSEKINWNKNKIINFYKKYNLEIIDFSDYKNVDTPIYCLNENGYKVKACITNLKSGNIPNLFKYNKYALYNVNRFCKLERPNYRLVKNQKYQGCKSNYKFIYLGEHLDDEVSKFFETSIDLFVNGRVSHPELNKTNGERKVENFLIKNNIDYDSQYKIDNCINPKTNYHLRFDFAVLNKEELFSLIEYDSEIHYKNIGYFNGKEGLKNRQYRDKIKNDYCKKNNIKLIRIPYWDFDNIEDILNKELKEVI